MNRFFIYLPLYKESKDGYMILLNKFNDWILKLAENINDKNYYYIIIILQKI